MEWKAIIVAFLDSLYGKGAWQTKRNLPNTDDLKGVIYESLNQLVGASPEERIGLLEKIGVATYVCELIVDFLGKGPFDKSEVLRHPEIASIVITDVTFRETVDWLRECPVALQGVPRTLEQLASIEHFWKVPRERRVRNIARGNKLIKKSKKQSGR